MAHLLVPINPLCLFHVCDTKITTSFLFLPQKKKPNQNHLVNANYICRQCLIFLVLPNCTFPDVNTKLRGKNSSNSSFPTLHIAASKTVYSNSLVLFNFVRQNKRLLWCLLVQNGPSCFSCLDHHHLMNQRIGELRDLRQIV